MAIPEQPIAIIGAGLSGLCLALALHQNKIPCVIYETRPQPLDIGGAIMLSPNALRILDRLGVYDRIAPLAYRFQSLHFRTENDQLLDTFDFGSAEKYGYDGMRIYRFQLIKVLLQMLSQAGIKPSYGKKFLNITHESEDGVTWVFEDGSVCTAPLLVGADGIHSRVRTYIDPGALPTFTNMIGVTAAIPTAQLGLDAGSNYGLPVTIMNKEHGAFVMAPQHADGSEVLIGKQCVVAAEPDRDGWDRLAGDKAWCVEFLRRGSETYPPLVGRAVSHISPDKVNLWPFYVIPKLDSWVSKQGRVVILGDAAHAIPPTAGQGVNQAFEDVYVFAGVMSRVRAEDLDVKILLRRWQEKRQERVDGVLGLNAAINKRRLPVQDDEAEVTAEAFDLGWLYGVEFDHMISQIVQGESASNTSTSETRQ